MSITKNWQDGYYINRTLCDVLEDMRRCAKTSNYGPMMSLIEEVQVLGNRMEAALSDKNNMKEMNEEWSVLRKKLKALRKEVKKVENGEDEDEEK